MSPSEQVPTPSPASLARRVSRVAVTIVLALFIAWACGAAMRIDARSATPPGFWRGLLHGGMMPVAWPTLLVGHDQDIYAARNEGRPYKLGYSMGVNLSGLIFFGWLFISVGSVRGLIQRRSPQ